MALRTLVALAVLCALAPATAAASARPNFPKTVSGTISGTSAFTGDGRTIKSSWTITGVRFKLVHVRPAEGSWTGFYNVAGGKVSYTETETGACGYSITQKFDLKPSMPKHNYSTPLALSRSLLSRDTYDGDLNPAKRWTVMEVCNYPDQDPIMEQKTVQPGDLFSTGEKAGKIGRAMKGKYVYRDDGYPGKTTTTYKWSLRPR